MSANAKKVFISYRHSDGADIAQKIKAKLDQSAYSAYDDVDLEAGLWNEQLQEAISSCSVFLPIVTDGYLERLKSRGSNIIKMEFELALQCLGPSGIVPFFPTKRVAEKSRGVKIHANPKTLLGDLQASTSDIGKLLQLISGICPTAYLEQAESYSLQSIKAWKAAQTGLLYDPQNAVQRRLSVDRSTIECTQDKLIELLDTHKNICISGDGGCGKTFLLQQMFSMLHIHHHYIAIYVKLSEVDFDAKDGNPILKHVQKQISDREDNLIRELHIEYQAPTVVFLLDGLNEVAGNQVRAISAINALTEESGISNIILTTRYLPSSLASKFTLTQICDLNDEEIQRYLGVRDIVIDPRSILKLPLYLRLYKLSAINKADGMRVQAPDLQTKYEILKEVFINHPVDKFGNTLTNELRAAYAYLLPFLCFRMTNENTFTVSKLDFIDNIDACLKAVPKEARLRASLESCFCFGRGITLGALPGSDYDQLIQSITDQLFPAVGDGEAGAGSLFQISHQDIRDFFAAHYIKSSLDYIAHIEITGAEDIWKSTLEQFDNRTFDTDAAPLLLETLKKQLVLPLEKVSRHHTLCVSLLRFLYYLSKNSIEGVHNGSIRKPEYCERFKDSLDSARSFVFDYRETYYVSPVDPAITGIVVQDAEVHRRLGEYSESNSVSGQLLSLAEFVKDEDLRRKAKNNIAKCTLYHAFDVAHSAGRGYSADAEKLYREAIRQLRENMDYELSANLLAMLLVSPDPVSRKYLNRLLGGDMAERRYMAYDIENKAYASSGDKYSLQALLSYILHGYIKVTGISSDGQPLVEKNTSDRVWDTRENKKDVLLIAEEYIRELSKQVVPSIVRCFSGLVLLQDAGSFDASMEELESSYQIILADNTVNASCLGCFVYALVNDKLSLKVQDNLLDSIWRTMDKKLTEHSADNFDAAYVLLDMKDAWQGIKRRHAERLSEELLSRAEEMLQALSNTCQQEDERWNP